MYRYFCISVYTLIFIFSVFSFLPKTSFAYTFVRNLSFGDVGPDVLELQKTLNTNEKTVVAQSGSGSLGNETMYFGPATKQAVIAFQNEHADQILTPLGLGVGTGFVGPSTRAVLNSPSSISTNDGFPKTAPAQSGTAYENVLPVQESTQPTQPTQSLNQFDLFSLFTEADNSKVQLAFMSANSGGYGSTLSLTGTGFLSTGNSIHFGPHIVSNVSSVNANNIVFTIPQTIPVGIYDIEVSNSKGKSESNSYFVVTANSGFVPKIISISPISASIGSQITILGENFTPTGNSVHTSFGNFSNLSSSDGKTLTFTLEAPSNLPNLGDIFKDNGGNGVSGLKIFIYVVNINGVSDKNSPAILNVI